ncbi:MAG TPA: RdgB/HAM1 family non-canonical purine NTP pyrophosphatase [Candidatus Competibacteraceae bacterium]|nr:RdgB/HAM1 family non-canonical purine NTP pyrophosphatase [Candidatus Competibacteraceae bacterium]HQA26212.1 RdgB/HAM1 family non-canonical purine NTP pyrophosphatase [Candidatus Competibacteraceae bacterium]HQD55426.1 RdgB/HAM1 family non-canonical purine NTP pyrophosphatase [Candidatus Competibacteraceae bacterium]
MHQWILATGNPGKVREFAAVLGSLGVEIRPQSAFGVPEAAETGLTFIENALIKARNATQHTGLPALADDSGLVVDALGGAPGIYSARYAGPDADDQRNLLQLLEAMRDIPMERRTARFVCALALLRHPTDPMPVLCQASWEGRITFEPSGSGGFGYDPVFLVPTEHRTSAELAPEVKNRLSHRGQALAELAQRLKLDSTPLMAD